MSYHNLRSKLNRAVAAYLVSAGCGSVNDILPAQSTATRPYPNTTVKSTIGTPDPPLSGDYRVKLHISIKGSATQGVSEPNPQLSRVNFDNRVSQTFDALMESDNGIDLEATAVLITAAGRALAVPADGSPAAILFAQNNADMADFSCLQWVDGGFGDGPANDEGCSWEEILIFDVLACASNVD